MSLKELNNDKDPNVENFNEDEDSYQQRVDLALQLLELKKSELSATKNNNTLGTMESEEITPTPVNAEKVNVSSDIINLNLNFANPYNFSQPTMTTTTITTTTTMSPICSAAVASNYNTTFAFLNNRTQPEVRDINRARSRSRSRSRTRSVSPEKYDRASIRSQTFCDRRSIRDTTPSFSTFSSSGSSNRNINKPNSSRGDTTTASSSVFYADNIDLQMDEAEWEQPRKRHTVKRKAAEANKDDSEGEETSVNRYHLLSKIKNKNKINKNIPKFEQKNIIVSDRVEDKVLNNENEHPEGGKINDEMGSTGGQKSVSGVDHNHNGENGQLSQNKVGNNNNKKRVKYCPPIIIKERGLVVKELQKRFHEQKLEHKIYSVDGKQKRIQKLMKQFLTSLTKLK